MFTYPGKFRHVIPALVAAIAAAGVLAAPAGADTIQTISVAATNVSGSGLPADAVLQFDLNSTAGTISISVDNTTADTHSATQLLRSIYFEIGNGSSDLTTASPSITSFQGSGESVGTLKQITVYSNGSYSTSTTTTDPWAASSSVKTFTYTYGSGTYTISNAYWLGDPPSDLLIGPPYGSPPGYTNANSSIAGNPPHNPFLGDTPTFVLSATGLTPGERIEDAVVGWGTTTGSGYTPTLITGTVPEPATLALLALGGLGLLMRRRARE